MQQTYIGLDIGTTSTKGLLFGERGEWLERYAVEYPLYSPTPGTAEQDPEEIFAAVIAVLRKLGAAAERLSVRVDCVALSSAMHSLILLDERGQPLTRSITWADGRAVAVARRIKSSAAGRGIYERTGTPIDPMSPFTKLAWFREAQPELYARVHRAVSIKEFVLRRLFGVDVVDQSIASATGLFNMQTRDWDDEALAVAGIKREQLSTIVPVTHQLQGLASGAPDIGLPRDTVFVVGASDGPLANLGVGAILPGEVAVTIGTSGAIRTTVDRPTYDARARTFCYALAEDFWIVGGAVNSGGILLRWARDELARSERESATVKGVDPYDSITKMAATISPGAEGLLFHPYLSGERAPLWNADARGSFFGLTLSHRKEHMIRAVLEGVLMNLYSVFLAVQEQIGAPKTIYASGGFARSNLWRQMMADVFDREIQFPEVGESCCFGVAVLGMYARGRIANLSEIKSMIKTVDRHEPDPAVAAVYRELMPLFRDLAETLTPAYSRIAEIQRTLYQQQQGAKKS